MSNAVVECSPEQMGRQPIHDTGVDPTAAEFVAGQPVHDSWDARPGVTSGTTGATPGSTWTAADGHAADHELAVAGHGAFAG